MWRRYEARTWVLAALAIRHIEPWKPESHSDPVGADDEVPLADMQLERHSTTKVLGGYVGNKLATEKADDRRVLSKGRKMQSRTANSLPNHLPLNSALTPRESPLMASTFSKKAVAGLGKARSIAKQGMFGRKSLRLLSLS